MVTGQMTYYLFLRGINVGGNHKVPMAVLKKEIEGLGFGNVRTLLNSGNVVVESTYASSSILQSEIENHLSEIFGFPIPSIVFSKEELSEVIDNNPFEELAVDENTRLYITFFKNPPNKKVELPICSEDKSFRILKSHQKVIYSVMDLSLGKTTKGMEILGKIYGKDLTTRNWNTVKKVFLL